MRAPTYSTGAASWPPPAPPSPPQTWNAPDAGIDDQLQHLADMHGRGDLTDAEFASAKARLLGGR
jgi:Short C-terminal domain